MDPKISVILPTFNGASRGYLRETIESVLNQSFQNNELIIIDDGSTDSTKDMCKQYLRDPRVVYFYQPNGGPANARNAGIKASSGEFVCFLDDDDIWKPNKLQRQVDFIRDRLNDVDKWGMVFTWVELIDAQGNIIGYRGHHEEGSIYKILFYEYTIDATSSVLIKREVFNKVGLFDESFRNCQDWDMWLRIAKEYLIFPIKEYLVQHREHTNRISANNEKVFFYEKAVLEKALSDAPPDVCPVDVFASCYLNRSVAFFASQEYHQFRRLLFLGAKLSPKLVKIEHVFLLLLSFSGTKTVNFVKTMKRYLHNRMLDYRFRNRPLEK